MQKRCDMVDIYKQCEESTVVVLKNGVCVGTAWLIAPGRKCIFITASHVIKDCETYCIQFSKSVDQSQKSYKLKVLSRDESNDILVFTLYSKEAKILCGKGLSLSSKDESSLKEGSSVFCISHPNGMRFVLQKNCYVSSISNGDRGYTKQKGVKYVKNSKCGESLKTELLKCF